MSERIRQLAEQAEDYATAEYDKWIPTPDFSGVPNIRKIFNEKFAELIILECDRYARSTWEHGHLLGGDLKRLFGFEE